MVKAVFCMFQAMLKKIQPTFIFLPEKSPKMIGKCPGSDRERSVFSLRAGHRGDTL